MSTAIVQELFNALRVKGKGGLDHSGVITLLEELIKYILGHSRVWAARCDEVADAVRPALRAEARA